jgi:hypothetical protein
MVKRLGNGDIQLESRNRANQLDRSLIEIYEELEAAPWNGMAKIDEF